MINISYDNGTAEQLTLVLSTRDYRHLGQISNVKNIKFTANLNGADELSFTVHKVVDDHKEVLWDDIFDLRLIWVKELDEYFQIEVEVTDQVYITKTITCTSLCEAELSQTYLHGIEINTTDDITRDDYDATLPTVLYRNVKTAKDEDEAKKIRGASLIHRILDKCPAYSIEHVDESIRGLQREFSISDQDVYSFLTGDMSEQYDCMVQFNSKDRSISIYDLRAYCLNNACNYYTSKGHYYRGDYSDLGCPHCGKPLGYYGKDTTVFVSTENLTDEVQFDTDVDSIKNCFRLEAGDDDMTAAVVNSNPSGSQYIYEFSPESRKDMPKDLVDAIDAYNIEWNKYNTNYTISLNSNIVTEYNKLCDKYNNWSIYHKGDDISTNEYWKKMPSSLNGYSELIPYYYYCIDFYSYLKSSMMPTVTVPKSTVSQAITYIKDEILNIAVGKLSSNSVTTVSSALLNWIKASPVINTGQVKIEVLKGDKNFADPTLSVNADKTAGTWNGTFKVTSHEDKTVFDTITKSITVTTQLETFVQEKLCKQIKKATEYLEEYNMLNTNLSVSDFTKELPKWSLKRIESFHDAIEAVLGVLIDAGQGTTDSELYNDFYKPYHDKLLECEDEIKVRTEEIQTIWGGYNDDGTLQVNGMVQYISEEVQKIHEALNLKNYLKKYIATINPNWTKAQSDAEGERLYKVYTTYIREDTYSNSNFVSDGLDNNEMFENAQEFISRASYELHKSATYQHSIRSTLNNLLAIDEFKPIINNFELGNWIRIKNDETIFRLRLISYSIDYDNLKTIDTQFSDVTITSVGLNDISSVLKQASNMASTYGYVESQAETGASVKEEYINKWIDEGLNNSLIRINNNDDEDIRIDQAGITARTYDDITDAYDPEQIRITHNVLAFTNDNWASVKTALGKINYHNTTYDSDVTTYGLIADTVMAGYIAGTIIESSIMTTGLLRDVTQARYEVIRNSYGTVIGEQNYEGDDGNYIYLNTDASTPINSIPIHDKFIKTKNFKVEHNGNIVSVGGVFRNADGTNYISLGSDSTYTDRAHFTDKDSKITFKVDEYGNCTMDGTVTARDGKIGGWELDSVTGNNSATLQQGSLHTSGAKLGGNNLSGMWLLPNDQSEDTTIGGGSGTDWRILIGNSSGKFGIKSNGHMYGTNVYLGNSNGDFIDLTGTYHNARLGNGSTTIDTNGVNTKAILVGGDGNITYQIGPVGISKNIGIGWGNNVVSAGSVLFDTMIKAHSILLSDIRVKNNIHSIDIKDSYELINSTNTYSFNYKLFNDPDILHYGVIAQELNENISSLGVDEKHNGLICIEDDGYYRVNYIEFIPHIINIIKNQQKEINELKEKIYE